jgi:glucose/arabinose dehydrogenase
MTNRRLPMFWASLLALSLISLHPAATSGSSAKRSQDITAAAVTIQLEPVLTGLSSPVYVTHAGDGSNRLFIIEQPGTIKVLQPGATSPTVFLNITARVLSGGEQGLLGLAFHPQFSSNHRFFVYYTRPTDGSIVIAEYHVSASDPNVADTTETIILTIPHPTNTNHNGGMMAFGPDGFLYIGTGDGGAANDPPNNSQNINVLLGKILRIDIDHPNGPVPYSSPSSNPFFGSTPGSDEIYALGLRNPWRYSFDRGTGQLYVGDVGQSAREEIDIVTLGGNYGWRIMEGTICNPSFNGGVCTPPAGHIPPIFEYTHSAGRCSITGGYVYRGQIGTLPTGAYIFADYCTGEIFLLENGSQTVLLDTSLNISSFGEDEAGEIYVVALGGAVYRITNPNAPCVFAINPASRNFPVNGGNGNLAVVAPNGCTWGAVSNASWINITSGSSSAGYSFVNFSVAPNDTPYSRSATLTVANRTFTVNQTADTDSDGIPDVVESTEGTNPQVKDNDVFNNARLFTMQQYRDFLGREGDPPGITYWTNAIQPGSLTRAEAIDSFFNSQEFQQEFQGLVSPIVRLYFACFLRIPDYPGLQFWIGEYRAGSSLASIGEGFAQSQEFLQRYGNLSNGDFVTALYQNVLGRSPDPSGFQYWTNQLNSGAFSRGQVMLGFSESPEFKQKSYNKVYVTTIYVEMLRRAPDQKSFDDWVAALDAGASGLQIIQAFLGAPEYHNRFLP